MFPEFNATKPIPYGYLSPSDVNILSWFSKGADRVVELGTLLGKSAAVMAHSAKQVITIDFFEGEPFGGEDSIMNELYSFKQVDQFFKEHYPNVTVRKGYSCALVEEYNEIDLLFIDADHTYPHVRNDLLSWHPKIKMNGTIIFHDFSDSVPNGVRAFITEIFPNLGMWGLERVWYEDPTIVFKKIGAVNVS
jgi:predicted O-methyltransferase YrrM